MNEHGEIGDIHFSLRQYVERLSSKGWYIHGCRMVLKERKSVVGSFQICFGDVSVMIFIDLLEDVGDLGLGEGFHWYILLILTLWNYKRVYIRYTSK